MPVQGEAPEGAPPCVQACESCVLFARRVAVSLALPRWWLLKVPRQSSGIVGTQIPWIVMQTACLIGHLQAPVAAWHGALHQQAPTALLRGSLVWPLGQLGKSRYLVERSNLLWLRLPLMTYVLLSMSSMQDQELVRLLLAQV